MDTTLDVMGAAFWIMGSISLALCVLGIAAMIRGHARGEISFSSDQDRRQ
jgi:hypothetical protein